MSRVFVLLGHPDPASYNAYLTGVVVAALQAAGYEVHRQDVSEMNFDPILHAGYREIQTLEDDLLAFQQELSWCEHWITVYPLWWGSTPALLQGLFDRAVLPGHAFQPAPDGSQVKPLLAGRTGHSVTTMDASAEYVRATYGDSDLWQLRAAVYEFCGFAAGEFVRIGQVSAASDEQRQGYAHSAASRLVAAMAL